MTPVLTKKENEKKAKTAKKTAAKGLVTKKTTKVNS